MQKNTIAGYVVTCVGDEKSYSYLPSRDENTLADKIALHVLKHTDINAKIFPYLERGSDERQFCSPGVDLPVVSVMRSKYDDFPEYHTSLDNLELITPKGLLGGYEVIRRCLECIEKNDYLRINVLCEPQLGKRGLYPSLSTKETFKQIYDLSNLIAYCDGRKSLLDIAEKINVPMWELFSTVDKLKQSGLLEARASFEIVEGGF
jgi:aminopeptidase-like protein